MPGGDRDAQKVELIGLSKLFGQVVAVNDVSFTIEPREFVTLLGPSGSGKSTTLMLIAGFERPSTGEVRLGGRRVNHVPPYRRNLGVVFQNYALFPHMTVTENLAFPLEGRGVSRAEITTRVHGALDRVRLTGHEDRYPSQLSGGQQQRVALARALVFDPPILLMDEPLSSLDKKLREQMQLEIKHIQRDLGITVIYVTHDQAEALTMSDRIAVMNHGRIVQSGTPVELYERPVDRFVADFIGETNLIELAVRVTRGNEIEAMTPGGMSLNLVVSDPSLTSGRFAAALRPERIMVVEAKMAANGDGVAWHKAAVEEVVYIGEVRKYRLRLGELVLIAKQQTRTGDPSFAEGAEVAIGWHPADLRPIKDEAR